MKKSFLNLADLPNTYDADLVKYLQVNDVLERGQTPTHSHFHRKFHNLKSGIFTVIAQDQKRYLMLQEMDIILRVLVSGKIQ